MIVCDGCGHEYDPVLTRWRCLVCGLKAECCSGSPLPPRKGPKG